ncbi:MAG: NgoPII family restriction endonuclease [Ghiorsea sp.]|nr:NgoPII family restriction endonuclease [Ghiorsea sp.]
MAHKYDDTFSYGGNANNIPDAMILGGDAIEVKKVESFNSGIPLNSSYPKDKLYADDHRINQTCRNSEGLVSQRYDLCYWCRSTTALKTPLAY